MKCECDETGSGNPAMEAEYDPVTEWPFVKHEPGECRCTNDLKRYERSDGSIKWLCSCCSMPWDKEVAA